MMRQLLAVLLCIVSVVEPAAPRASIRPAACNATLKNGCSIGGNAYKQLKGEGAAACCAACVADTKCAGFVISNTGNGECLLKADLGNPHAKSSNDCAAVRGSPTPMPPPPAPAPPPTPPPAGSPKWELVSIAPHPVIGSKHPDAISASILTGFETGQYQRINDTFYLTANELGMCAGVVWDLVTRAALWSAPNSTVSLL